METRAQRSSMAEIDVSNQSFGTETESSTMSREESIGFRLDRLEQTMEKQKEMWDKFFATVMAKVQNLSNSRSSIAEVCEDALVALNQLQETTLEIQTEPESCVEEIIADSKQDLSPTMSDCVVYELMEHMDSIGEIDELQSQVHNIETVTFLSPPIHDLASDSKVKATGTKAHVPIFALESSPRLSNNRIDLEELPNDSMRNNQFQSSLECDDVSFVDQTGFHVKIEGLSLESSSDNHRYVAHKLLDEMLLGVTSLEKLMKPLKNWKFKFKTGFENGLQFTLNELIQLGVTDEVIEVELRHKGIRKSTVYLLPHMQFLEDTVAMRFARSDYVEAQEALVKRENWYNGFPKILQAFECAIELLRGQDSHFVGSYNEAAFHCSEAVKLKVSKSMQIMCQTFAVVFYLTFRSVESVDLVRQLCGMMNSLSSVWEEANSLLAYSLMMIKHLITHKENEVESCTKVVDNSKEESFMNVGKQTLENSHIIKEKAVILKLEPCNLEVESSTEFESWRMKLLKKGKLGKDWWFKYKV